MASMMVFVLSIVTAVLHSEMLFVACEHVEEYQFEFQNASAAEQDVVQPGDIQPGDAQPGNVQPDYIQPGNVQPGNVQPDYVQPGNFQPGYVQSGNVQPGYGQPGNVQPGYVQRGDTVGAANLFGLFAQPVAGSQLGARPFNYDTLSRIVSKQMVSALTPLAEVALSVPASFGKALAMVPGTAVTRAMPIVDGAINAIQWG